MSHTRLLAIPLAAVLLMLAGATVPTLGQGQVIIIDPGPIVPPQPPWPPPPWPPPHPPPWPPRPRPPIPPPVHTTTLELKYLRVYADITDGVAVTRVEQTFRNQLSHQVEGTYVFPLPDDAAVGDFSMVVNGKEMRGEVLDKDAARRTYEEIVRRTRDPGLLEYLGTRLYRASIFPVPPGSQLDVKLQYSYPIRESDGLGLFRHPLRSHPAGPTVEQTVVQVRLRSTLPLTSVFCPSHKCDIVRPNDHDATATFEQPHSRLDSDFLLYYQRKDALFGLSLLTHRAAGEPGYFLLRLSPRIEIDASRIQPKDIAFVIDTSGSMSGGKLDQVKRALKFCISSLADRDRFNIYAFSTDVRPFRETLVPTEGDLQQAALEFTDKLQPVGGTNIHQALLAALAGDPRDEARPYLIVFMTDGQPTVDVTDPAQILRNVEEKNSRRVRFHVLGVGTDVNTHLLDKLAEINRGTRDYCVENEDLELKLSAFYKRLANPVLTDLALIVSGLNTFDLYPGTLPDLFRGNDLMVLGRYEGEGHHAVELKGRLENRDDKFIYEGDFPKLSSANDFLPRLWATRKVGYLLDQIRLHGEKKELIDEVVRLAKLHGIVTPYTSALILEDEGQLARQPRTIRSERVAARDQVMYGYARRAAGEGGDGRGVMLGKQTSGDEAVETSIEFRRLEALGYLGGDDTQLAVTGPAGGGASTPVVRHVADKTFVFDGERWVDTAWDGKQEPKKVTAFGDAYFELLSKHARLARYLALGERVVVVLDGEVYETVPEST